MTKNTYYDSWAHARQIFLTRIFEFLFLSLFLGLATWLCLLHFVFDIEFIKAISFTLKNSLHLDKVWNAVLSLCGLVGLLLSSCLFIWLLQRKRLSNGDRYRRGARVEHREFD